jgi:hypothetical protein
MFTSVIVLCVHRTDMPQMQESISFNATSDKSSLGANSNTKGEIFVRKKWSGQDVPSGANFSKSLELMNSNTRHHP